MSNPTVSDLVEPVIEDNKVTFHVPVTIAHQPDWEDDLQPGEDFLQLRIGYATQFDHVRLFDLADDDGEKYFRIAVPMPADENIAEALLELIYSKGERGWGTTSLRDVSRSGGIDYSMG